MNCPKCKRPVDKNSRFCNVCGAPLSSPAAAQQQGQQKVHVGDLFDGKWRVKSTLGQGGMGAVFLAHDESLDREVAIKILAAKLCNDEEFVERFEREARLTAKFEHPNIVPIYAVGRFGTRPFIVMKLLDGVPLTNLIKANPHGMPVQQIISLMRQLCDGFGFIHSKGFVHRDVKSANIQVSEQGMATILDFGIIKDTNDTHSKTRAGTLMGTPHYMAPEQATGKTADARADLYALGCIVFEMLTGHLPFTKGNDFDILKAHVKTPPPDVCAERKDIPAEVGEVVKKMLAKSPDDRYQTAKELFEALEHALVPQIAASQPAAPPAEEIPQKRTVSRVANKAAAAPADISPATDPHPSSPRITGERRHSSPEAPRRTISPKSKPRIQAPPIEPPVPAAPQPGVPLPAVSGRRSKVEIRERPSARRLREERERQKKSPLLKLFLFLFILLLLAGGSAYGIFYAWGHAPQAIPPALMVTLETKVRPAVQNIPFIADRLPPDPKVEEAKKAAAEAAIREEAARLLAASEAADAGQPEESENDAQNKTRKRKSQRRANKSSSSPAAAPAVSTVPAPSPEPESSAPTPEPAAPAAAKEPAAPTAPPAPAPRICYKGDEGVLRVLTKPTWGTVTVDGAEWGQTPVTKPIGSGLHKIRVSRGGFQTAEETVCVEEGKTPTIITVRLEKSP